MKSVWMDQKHNLWCEGTHQDLINLNFLTMNVTIFTPDITRYSNWNLYDVCVRSES